MEPKTKKMVGAGLAVCVAGLLFAFVVRPRMELRTVAKETCDELDGAIMLQVGSILSKAYGRAKRLGFEPFELGDRMREECPGLMSSLDKWAREH